MLVLMILLSKFMWSEKENVIFRDPVEFFVNQYDFHAWYYGNWNLFTLYGGAKRFCNFCTEKL